jgi:hypothetical protein
VPPKLIRRSKNSQGSQKVNPFLVVAHHASAGRPGIHISDRSIGRLCGQSSFFFFHGQGQSITPWIIHVPVSRLTINLGNPRKSDPITNVFISRPSTQPADSNGCSERENRRTMDGWLPGKLHKTGTEVKI